MRAIDAARQKNLDVVPVVTLPEVTVTMASKAPSFAALMGIFRVRYDSEVQAAAVLIISPSALSDYCDGKSLPTAPGIQRLAPALGMAADELSALVEAQRAAMARGESIPTVAPVRPHIRRLPVTAGQGV